MTVAGRVRPAHRGMGLDKSEQELNETTGVAASCGQYAENAAIAKGMNWIGAQFNFESAKSTFYNFYGIERLGRLSGQRFIGKYDWYREGCENLVAMQEIGGAIGRCDRRTRRRRDRRHARHHDLVRAPVPLEGPHAGAGQQVRLGRLPEHGQWARSWKCRTGARNGRGELEPQAQRHPAHRRVLQQANSSTACRCRGRCTTRAGATSRTIGAARTGKEKILEEVGATAPVAGAVHERPRADLAAARADRAQEEILKNYVEEGGFILAEACCGDKEFNESFKALMHDSSPTIGSARWPRNTPSGRCFPGSPREISRRSK